jgi:alpha-ketoglutarate-dependent taurine dioxygenase
VVVVDLDGAHGRPLTEQPGAPLVITPAASESLNTLIRGQRDPLLDLIVSHGCVLFRGFDVTTPEAFHDVAATLTPEMANYVEGSSPRVMITDKVYTSTEYPARYFISLHNELSYAHRWPRLLYFFCQAEPDEGGETPLCSSATVFQQLPSEIRQRFLERGIRYTRNMHGGAGIGLSWQTVFETDDRAWIEDYCRSGAIEYSWTPEGGMRTSQIRPAAVRHPRSGAELWFSQADQWHPTNLEPKTRRALVSSMPEADFPINATYGTGEPIEDEILDIVRATYRAAMITFPWRKGDVLVVDNMLVAHGRMPYTGPRRVLVAMGGLTALNEVELLGAAA